MSRKKDTGEPRDSAGREVKARSNNIWESHNTYIAGRGDRTPEEISNFVMRPVNGIQSEDNYFVDIEFTTINGRVFQRRFCGTDFSTAQKFKVAIKQISGLDMVYSGTEKDLANIQLYMNNKYREYNHCKGVSCIGLYQDGEKWNYVGMDASINHKNEPIDSIISIVESNGALNSDITRTEMISGSELKTLAANLFKFNIPERTVSILGWCCVCFFKERLRQKNIKLSHLVLEGAAGSGKSETLEKVIQPIFGLTGSGIACSGITKFSNLKSTSSTNTLPIIFEEYKPHKMGKIAVEIVSAIVRDTYDCHTEIRGRQNLSVVNYMRKSPICIVGEAGFNESAARERIIDVQFAVSDRTAEHTENFKQLEKNRELIGKLGKSMLMLALNMPDDSFEKFISESKVFEQLNLKSRVELGISNLYLGILLLKDLFEAYHLDFEKYVGITLAEIRSALTNNVMGAMDEGGGVRSATDNIIQKFDVMALKGRIRKGEDFIVDREANELCLRVKDIYDEFTKYVREFDVQDIDMLPQGDFTKQLRKEAYFKDYALRKFSIREDGKTIDKRVRCFVLDLKKLNQCCQLEMFADKDPDDIETDNDGFIKVDSQQMDLPFS